MKIKNISGEDRLVPWLGGRMVLDGQVVDIPAEDLTAFTQQESTWAPADPEAVEAHGAMLQEIATLLALPEDPSDPEQVAEKGARDLATSLQVADRDQAATVLETEKAAPRPRKTVIEAAEKRLADLDDHTPEG